MKHRRADVSPFECEWVTVKKSKPVNNIDAIAIMAAWFVGMLVFCFIVGSLVIW
jgi:hypothetical protein